MKKKGKKYIAFSVMVLVLVLSVVGATYAYFALRVSNNSITATVGGGSLSLSISKLLPTSATTKLLPQMEETLGEAISSTYNCIDGDNNVVCHVYKATITNNSTYTNNLRGVISFSSISTMPNLKWRLLDNQTTLGTYESKSASTSKQLFVESVTLAPSASSTYYFVVWINETGAKQTDNGTYRIKLDFEPDENNSGVTSTVDPTITLLNQARQGAYVAYTGSGGTVGSTQVQCQTNGEASSSSATVATESPNSCSGQNAREDLEADSSLSGTYGYCSNSSYKYTTTGWRVAYIDKTDSSNPKAVLISAGSPECNTRTSIAGNTTYIKQANAYALKYCNSDFVDGNCTCEVSDDETVSGGCTTPSTDAWAVNDNDFYQMIEQMNGTGFGRKLTAESSDLNVGYCSGTSVADCGLGNTLIDNGGYYWFGAQYTSTSTYGVYWYPSLRSVRSYSDTFASGLRPVISLSSSVQVTGGTGTFDDPYQISN